jgi:hypothetical protein
MATVSQSNERPRWWYLACRRCTAKWFARQKRRHCIRCGASTFVVPAVPPWQKHGRRLNWHPESNGLPEEKA